MKTILIIALIVIVLGFLLGRRMRRRFVGYGQKNLLPGFLAKAVRRSESPRKS